MHRALRFSQPRSPFTHYHLAPRCQTGSDTIHPPLFNTTENANTTTNIIHSPSFSTKSTANITSDTIHFIIIWHHKHCTTTNTIHSPSFSTTSMINSATGNIISIFLSITEHQKHYQLHHWHHHIYLSVYHQKHCQLCQWHHYIYLPVYHLTPKTLPTLPLTPPIHHHLPPQAFPTRRPQNTHIGA